MKGALDQGLETTIRALRRHQRVIVGLPTTGVPGRLRSESADDIDLVTGRLAREDFYKHAADLNTTLTGLHRRVAKAVSAMESAQQKEHKGSG